LEKISQYCQKCRAANEPGDANCLKCGTPLMLVVYPPSMRHDEILIPSYYEDHLLERVSLLELRLSQITERMSVTLDLMLKQAQTIQADHALIQTILETLHSFGLEKEKFIQDVEKGRQRKKAEAKKRNRIEEILSHNKSSNNELFRHLVTEGVELLKKTEEKQAFQMLERAALLSPNNVPLLLFIAESLFRADRFDAAKQSLEETRRISPQNKESLLLLGAIYADENNGEKSRKLLSVLASDPQTEIACNYIWGMLAASEENWLEALAAFKTVLEKADSAELNYLTGCVYFQLHNIDKARNYFQKAIEKDEKFADSWFMLSLVEPEEKLAEEDYKKACEATEAGAQCLEFLKGNKQPGLKSALPFQNLKKQKRLLTNSSLRLSRFFRELIFDAIG
jgi:tetratricopeptide (TPR) repeat protein